MSSLDYRPDSNLNLCGEAYVALFPPGDPAAIETWPQEGAEVRVRMGLHSGDPIVREDSYTGMGVHRAARISAAGHGGQVLLSNATRELVKDDLPEGVRFLQKPTHLQRRSPRHCVN